MQMQVGVQFYWYRSALRRLHGRAILLNWRHIWFRFRTVQNVRPVTG
jgi:hypothetical protein